MLCVNRIEPGFIITFELAAAHGAHSHDLVRGDLVHAKESIKALYLWGPSHICVGHPIWINHNYYEQLGAPSNLK